MIWFFIAGQFSRTADQDQEFTQLEVWQSRRATLPNQIERPHVRTQAEEFNDVTREAGTQVPSTRTYDYCIYFSRFKPGILKRALACLGGQRRRLAGEAVRKRIWVNVECVLDRIDGEATCIDSIIIVQNRSHNEASARIQAL
ncbi:hypothetical protein GCM10027046_26470 [Uliginosibacterium flavum]